MSSLKRESRIFSPGESWLGLDNLHRLTSQRSYKLKITMTDFDQREYVAVFDHFEVRPKKRGNIDNITDLKTQVGPGDEYRLTLRGFNDGLSTLVE